MAHRGNIIGLAAGNTYRFYFDEHNCKDVRCFEHHYHAPIELLFILEGEFCMGTDTMEVVLHKGDVFVANSREVHFGYCPGRPGTKNVYRYLQLNTEQLPAGLSNRLDHLKQGKYVFSNYIPAKEAAESGLFEYGIKLLDQCFSGGAVDSLDRLGFVILTLRALLEHRQYKGRSNAQVGSEFVEDVRAYLEKHYSEPLSLEQIADEFGYEKSYFCHKFHQEFGAGFTKVLRSFRMEKFITHPALSLQTISFCARDVGFQNYSHFFHHFKMGYKVSPREFIINRAIGQPQRDIPWEK